MNNFFPFIIFIGVLLSCNPAQKGHNNINGYGVRLSQLPFTPKSYVCYKASETLTIDGELNEPSWQNAQWSDNFEDIEGELKPAPRFNTRMKMLWDNRFLYVAAELEEPHIWGTLTERDCVIFYDNDFEVFIDPDGDTHGYYEFEMNALNTVWDLLLVRPYREGQAVLDHWNYNGLKSGVKIYGTINNPVDTDKKWTVEIAFPLDALREFNNNQLPRQGEQWRINFSRVEWRTTLENGKYVKETNPETGKPYPEDNWVWSPQGEVSMHLPEMWGFLQFSEKTADTGNDDFVYNTDEDIKWELRNIYYAQRIYRSKHGKYAKSLEALSETGFNLTALKYSPKLETTSSLYEITAYSKENIFLWHIDNFGKTWKSKR